MDRRYILIAVFVSFSTLLIGQAPALPPGATIEGHVTNSDSGFVFGARVTMTPQAGGTVITADSNADGSFHLSDLTPGRYTIAVTKSGYLRSAHAGPLNITLTADQQLKNVSLELSPASVIAGHVLDEDGRPVALATVIALKSRYDNGREYLLPPRVQRDWVPGGSSVPQGIQVETGPDGEYRLFGLESGDYYVGVWRKVDNAMQSFSQPYYYPGAVDPDLAVAVSVESGRDQFGLDVHLTNHPKYRVQFKAVVAPCGFESKEYGSVRMFTVVRQSAGGLRIPIGSKAGSDRVPFVTGLSFPASATASPFTDIGDSTWVSPALYPGVYDIVYTSCFIPRESAAGNVGQLRVNVVDRDIDSPIMDVRESVALRGHLIAASDLSERVNLKGLRVALMDLDDRTSSMLPSGGVFQGTEPLLTLKDGVIGIPHMPAGHYAIGLLSGPTRLPADVYVASIRIGGREVRERGFDLDGSIDSLEIRLEGNGGVIDGVVLNAKQEPVTSAQVVLIPPSAQRNNVTLFRTASPDQNGMFSIPGVAPGDYQLFAWGSVDPGDYQNPDFLKRFEGREVKVHVERGTISSERLNVILSN